MSVADSSVFDRIQQFNHDRLPDRLPLKYEAMAADAFGFFRGTCHLFYEDLSHSGELRSPVPAVWSCGDLHVQNFGTFKGEAASPGSKRKLVYFDINDFDEAALLPVTWDLVRFVTSLGLIDFGSAADPDDWKSLAHSFLQTYAQTLAIGKACVLYREDASGIVKDLLQSRRNRDRAQFLKKRLDRKLRALKRIPHKILTAQPDDLERVCQLLQPWITQQPNPEFFQILDVAYRIAGNSSLGLDRYLILIRGDGYPKRSYLLDLKSARQSCLTPYLTLPQPQWQSDADRITQIQNRLQAASPALLYALGPSHQSYVLRELQPTEDKIDLNVLRDRPKRLKGLIQTLAHTIAWGHLRSSGRQGSAIADELIDFAQQSQWQTEILTYASQAKTQIQQDHLTFQTHWANSSATTSANLSNSTLLSNESLFRQ